MADTILLRLRLRMTIESSVSADLWEDKKLREYAVGQMLKKAKEVGNDEERQRKDIRWCRIEDEPGVERQITEWKELGD